MWHDTASLQMTIADPSTDQDNDSVPTPLVPPPVTSEMVYYLAATIHQRSPPLSPCPS